eukprot:CAMPEP_0202385048 /NCGR_PEP_ID=MMETSP1127-20130417/58548_1 /ASSEMBLY_ACC=CAM_ASM_000462 /TAXON_ID=3047 /ORGANISM="Dunaliella tertiolecta, Strain CCMP1320" /LENGTH=51 /DNA_ID=CAMNT_0048985075 /DNA_START=124 /DNA_END=275 /DNA_ORIENTATION=+
MAVSVHAGAGVSIGRANPKQWVIHKHPVHPISLRRAKEEPHKATAAAAAAA